MKQLIVIFAMLFTSVVLAQQTDINSLGQQDGDGISYADSLYYGTPGDSVIVLRWNNRFSYPQIYLEGNGNATTDSITVVSRVIRYSSRGVAIDTLTGSTAMLLDSANADQSTVINNTVGVNYLINEYSISLLEISLINYRAAVADRKVHFVITAKQQTYIRK